VKPLHVIWASGGNYARGWGFIVKTARSSFYRQGEKLKTHDRAGVKMSLPYISTGVAAGLFNRVVLRIKNWDIGEGWLREYSPGKDEALPNNSGEGSLRLAGTLGDSGVRIGGRERCEPKQSTGTLHCGELKVTRRVHCC